MSDSARMHGSSKLALQQRRALVIDGGVPRWICKNHELGGANIKSYMFWSCSPFAADGVSFNNLLGGSSTSRSFNLLLSSLLVQMCQRISDGIDNQTCLNFSTTLQTHMTSLSTDCMGQPMRSIQQLATRRRQHEFVCFQHIYICIYIHTYILESR